VPLVAAAGVGYDVVPAKSVKYVYVRPEVLPAVTDASVRFTVAGAHTATGFVMVTTGVGLTICVLLAVATPHEPPLVVNTKVAVPLYAAGGVQFAFNVVAPGENVPPAVVDHVPPVADPPILPPNETEVPP